MNLYRINWSFNNIELKVEQCSNPFLQILFYNAKVDIWIWQKFCSVKFVLHVATCTQYLIHFWWFKNTGRELAQTQLIKDLHIKVLALVLLPGQDLQYRHTHTHIHGHLHTDTHTYTHTHTRTHTHTYIHVHTYRHAHVGRNSYI